MSDEATEEPDHFYINYVFLHGCTEFPEIDSECEPVVLESFPTQFPEDITTFLWPEAVPPPRAKGTCERHSFLLTGFTGAQQYVHALRLWLAPPDSTLYYPYSIAICTEFKIHKMFSSILETVEDLFSEHYKTEGAFTLKDVASIIFSTLYIPTSPLHSRVKFKLFDRDFSALNPLFSFPADSLPPNDIDYEPLFRNIEPRNIILIFTALMTCDCSVLIYSPNPSNLFNICEALLSLLYPFNWPVSYIPVLPRCKAFDLIHLPQVYLMGLCSDQLYDPPDSIMIVNLEDNSIMGRENLRTKLPLDIWYRIHRGIQRYCPYFSGAAASPDDLPLSLLTSFTSQNNPSLRSRFSLVGRLPSPRISYEDLMAQNSGSEEEEEVADMPGPMKSMLRSPGSNVSLSTFLASTPPVQDDRENRFHQFRGVTLSVFVSFLQGYRSYLRVPSQKELKDLDHFSYFSKDLFVERHPRRSERPFLDNWVKSQIFSAFVHERLTLTSEDHFERCLRKKYLVKKDKKQKLESTGICGVMWKMGSGRQSWKKRFFMLQGNVLSYFSAVKELLDIVQTLAKAKADLECATGELNIEALRILVGTLENELADTANSRRKGDMELPINTTTIGFPDCDDIVGTIESKFFDVPTEHAFFVQTPERIMYMAANSKSDRRSWMQHIQARTTLLAPNPLFEPLQENILEAVKAHRRQRLNKLR